LSDELTEAFTCTEVVKKKR